MSYKNTNDEYGSVAKFFHWFIGFGIVGMLIFGFLLDCIKDESLQAIAYPTHKLVGLFLLDLVILRLVWRFVSPPPAPPEGMSAFEKMLEKLGHLALYGLMIAMPLSGWIMSTAKGHAPMIFGHPFPFPGITEDKVLGKTAGNLHWWFAWAIIVMVSLHVIAALWHHFCRKDNVLKRMSPRCCDKKCGP